MELIKLKDVMPDEYTGFLSAMSEAPWAEETNIADVDDVYLLSHSGQKYIAPLMRALLNSDNKLTQSTINKAASYAFAIYGKNWTNLWDVLQAEYNPIENYNMTEERTDDPSGKEITTLSHTGFDKTETTGEATDNVQDSSVYGMNSSGPVPASKVSTTSGVTVERTPGVTDTTEKSFDHRQDHYLLTRSGNIGVTTNQQMQMSSIELWKWNFWLQVFDDLDSCFCLDCY